jgi:DNA replication protein DnaC
VNETTYQRLKDNLESLKFKHTLDIIDNYLERALKDDVNIVDVLDHIFREEAQYKRKRAIEQQIQPLGSDQENLESFDFSFRHPSPSAD